MFVVIQGRHASGKVCLSQCLLVDSRTPARFCFETAGAF